MSESKPHNEAAGQSAGRRDAEHNLGKGGDAESQFAAADAGDAARILTKDITIGLVDRQGNIVKNTVRRW